MPAAFRGRKDYRPRAPSAASVGLIGRLFQVVGIVILLAIGFGAFLWFSDYAVESELTDRGEDGNGKWIAAQTKLGGYEVRQGVDAATYTLLDARCFSAAKPEDGPCFVTFTVQTKVLRVYANEGGDLLFES